MSSLLSEEKRAELKARMDAAPSLPWDGMDAYIEHAMSLVRPGGMMSVVLPDGRPFLARRATESAAADPPAGDALIRDKAARSVPTITCPHCRMTSTHPRDIESGWCGNCHAFTSWPMNHPPDDRTGCE